MAQRKSKADWAWLAGIIDGEGCINVAVYRGSKIGRYQLGVRVKMTHRPTIERCGEIAGVGRPVYSIPRDSGRKKALYSWHVTRTVDVQYVLRNVLPYLTTKKAQALVGLEFPLPRKYNNWSSEGRGRSAICRALQVVVAQAMSNLNQRGATSYGLVA